MSRPSGYIVSINAPETLQVPRGPNHREIGRKNGEAMIAHFRACLEQLVADGAFEGIRIEQQMPNIGALVVDGPQEQIDRLKALLKEKNLGIIGENCELRVVR